MWQYKLRYVTLHYLYIVSSLFCYVGTVNSPIYVVYGISRLGLFLLPRNNLQPLKKIGGRAWYINDLKSGLGVDTTIRFMNGKRQSTLRV